MRVETVFRGGTVLTMDEARPRAEALATHHGRIVAVGPQASELPADRVIELNGATVVPGFHDAHTHTVWFGLSLAELPLSTPPVHSLAELYEAVSERAACTPHGGWVIGSGYDQNKLGGAHPHRRELDRAAGQHRVWLKHTSGHMCVVNSRVLNDLQLDRVRVPEGGVIQRDADGPTGLVQERAQALVRDLIYPYPLEVLCEAIGRAHQQYLREGITSCQDAGVGIGWIGHSPRELAAYQQARAQGLLQVRTTAMVTADSLHPAPGGPRQPEGEIGLDLGLHSGFGDDLLRLGPVKLFADGSLLGRTAAMREDYADQPGNHGYLQMDEETLRATVLAAHRTGWQIATHAIGDHAIDVVLDSYAAALAAHPRPDHRHRIEHAGVVHPGQLRRIAALGVLPVPQGRFIGALGESMRTALGPQRTRWCYRQHSFLKHGITLAASSDRPVVHGPPLLGIHDMVNQRTEAGHPFNPAETLSPAEALHAYTLGSAYAAFLDSDRGSLRPGKLADLTILSENPTRCPSDQVRDIDVLATVIGGRFAYGGARFEAAYTG